MGFLRDLGGWHLLIILVIIVLIFGASRLPAVSKSLGQSMRIFRREVKEMKDENKSDKTGDTADSAAADPATTPDDKK